MAHPNAVLVVEADASPLIILVPPTPVVEAEDDLPFIRAGVQSVQSASSEFGATVLVIVQD